MSRFKSSHPEHQKYEDAVVVQTSVAELISTAGATTAEVPIGRSLLAILNVTAAGTLVGDELDVFLGTRIGGVWVDVVHFLKVLGNGGAQRIVAKISQDVAEAVFNNGAALAADTTRHVIGDLWRSRSVIVDGGGTHSFTYTVTIQPMG